MANVNTILVTHPEKCTGCRLCELSCGMEKVGEYALSQSRVRRALIPEDSYSAPVVCQQCVAPACAEVCPTGALRRDDEHGAVALETERCVGCALCTLACSHAGIFYSPSQRKPDKCDLCGGDPQCAKNCPSGAIEVVNAVSSYNYLRNREDLLSPGISACLGCAAEMSLRLTLRALGPNTILAIPPGCLGGVGVVGWGTTTGAKVPVFFPLLDNVASMLAGTKRYYQSIGRDVHVVAFAGDGGTADVGFQCLSGAAEREENIIYICYDNEGYMNTGIQRSSTTPYGAWTTTTPVGQVSRGKKQKGKDMPLIMAMHGIPYTATACIAFLDDYLMKLEKAMQVKNGLSYIHIFSPCPTGWRFPADKTIEVARAAVETDFFPLWEAEGGKFRITHSVERPRPVEHYLRMVGKYRHLVQPEIDKIQEQVSERLRRLKVLATLGSNE